MKNFRTVIRAFLIATLCCFCSRSLRADEDRLWVDATINGKPVKLVLDTGCGDVRVVRPMAERLGLHVTNWPSGKKVDPGKVPYGQAEPCVLAFGGLTNNATFAVIDVPSVLRSEVQGVLGWPVWSRSIIRFDCVNHRFESLDRVPEDVSRWQKFNLRRSASVLVIDVPDKSPRKRQHPGGHRQRGRRVAGSRTLEGMDRGASEKKANNRGVFHARRRTGRAGNFLGR
jgi:Predicted aspartyl protease